MSERSSFVSDVFFEEAQAEKVARHIAGRLASAHVLEVSAGAWVVVGYIAGGYPGGERESFSGLAPLQGGLSLVVNCDCAPPFRWRLDEAREEKK